VDLLPDTVQPLSAAALAEMQADPQHRLPPRRRQAMYTALAAAPKQTLRAAPYWQAVPAAERVLPLVQAQCPADELSPALLATAIGMQAGHMDEATAAELEALGCHASNNAWGYEAGELPWPVGLAADAAFHALKEARGHQLLSDLQGYLRQSMVELQPAPRPAGRPAQPVPDDASLNDEVLCQMDNSDTASIAAAAAASTEFGPTCEPERPWAFWTWWLQEALPGAVAAARRGRLA
jgi:hypothetical protein